MAEYIDREALITKFKQMELGEHSLVERLFADGVYAVIASFPASGVAPVVHGKWIKYPRARYFKCSECKCIVPYKKAMIMDGERKYKYCPNCGAKMDECNESEN